MKSASKTVLMIAWGGQGARLLLQTDFLPTLQSAGIRVVVMTPGAVMPTLSPNVRPELLAIEPLAPEAPQPGGRVVSLLRALVQPMRRAALNARKSPAFTPRYRKVRAAYTGVWPRWVSLPMHWVITQMLWRAGFLRKLICRLDTALSGQSANADVFERYQPDLVIGGGLGYQPPDEAVFQEAAVAGVRTAALISNWDNPTSKGYRAASFDLVVAWSERMRKDIVQLHDLSPDRVKVGGVPHWDHYLAPDGLPSREELCTALGLDVSKKLVFHAAFPPTGGTEPFELISSTLAEAITSGRFGADVQLVIRLHPKHMHPKNEQTRRPYEALATMDGIHLNYPDVDEADLLYEPTLEDGRILSALLGHCDVLVNIFSTTTLEAFLLDRPVVMAVPGPAKGKHMQNSYIANPRLWTEYSHLQPLMDSRAARVAYTPEELVEHVRRYLDDPSLDRDKRRAIASLECGPTDGHAGERTARLVLDELGRGAPGVQAFGVTPRTGVPA